MPEIAIGRKEIMIALHVDSWKTIRRWKRDYGLPLGYLPNRKPTLAIDDLKNWMRKRHDPPLTPL